jgi:sugar phosphate isomerase/epimerase
MDFSIASWSFHRLLEAGKQDMFQYITDCKTLGCTYLDPWNGHLAPLVQEADTLKMGTDAGQTSFSAAGLDYAKRVKAAADAAGMPVSCLAVDGAHIYEPTPEARQANRANAYRWLEVAKLLGAEQMRIDSGGKEDLPGDQFDIIVEGLRDVTNRARDLGIQVVIENHWGASRVPENVLQMLKAVEGMGLLFDTQNFAPEDRERGWQLLAPYARSVHIKIFDFDADGNDPSGHTPRIVKLLVETGYKGCWGIESVPRDGDEIGAARKTIALIRRTLSTS